MAIGMVFDAKGVTQAQYDQVRKEVSPDNVLPKGMLHHSAGPTANGWCVVEVWDSPEDAAKFFEQTLGSALKRASITVEPTQFKVHNTMK